MKKILLLILLAAGPGCRTYNYSKTEFSSPGQPANTLKVRVLMFFSNTKVEYVKVAFYTNRAEITIRKGTTEIDDESVAALTKGITSAVIESFKRP